MNFLLSVISISIPSEPFCHGSSAEQVWRHMGLTQLGVGRFVWEEVVGEVEHDIVGDRRFLRGAWVPFARGSRSARTSDALVLFGHGHTLHLRYLTLGTRRTTVARRNKRRACQQQGGNGAVGILSHVSKELEEPEVRFRVRFKAV